MIEDDIYRTSTQYRFWSYTSESLASLRQEANAFASERVRAAFGRIRTANEAQGTENGKSSPGNETTDISRSAQEVKTLTVDEELKVVNWGCTKIIETGKVMNPPIPMEIRATAIQFLRRFYLTNSPMTYHPKQILTCALFLATKTDHWHMSLSNFVANIPDTEAKYVQAPEFLLMQGLRFTLDVRHPMKGLEGGVGQIQLLLDEKILHLDGPDPKRRLGKAADQASQLLREAAQMTDVYFLYTPSQIWLAALLAADAALVNAFLAWQKTHSGPEAGSIGMKLESTLKACAEALLAYRSEAEVKETEQKQMKREMKRIGRKLHLCQNPEKTDIVAIAEQRVAAKRDGNESDRERVLKKRKLERKRLEQDGDVFGTPLSQPSM